MEKFFFHRKIIKKTRSLVLLLWLVISWIVISALGENQQIPMKDFSRFPVSSTGLSYFPLAIIVHATATPDTICQGSQTQLEVEVTGGIAPFIYHWSSNPPGFSSNIPDPVSSPMVPTWFIVEVTDVLFQTGRDSVFVGIADPPPPPGNITGPVEVCKNSHASYSIAPVPGAYSYSWTVPEGDTIENGQNTTTIDVFWHSTPGSVSVIAGNDCGNSVQSVLEVTLRDTVADPGPIAGSDTACKSGDIEFSITPVLGSTGYFWMVPSDASIIQGDNTPSIEVLWGTMCGQVSVVARNICGDSHHTSIKTVITDSVPEPPMTITGKDSVCQGETGYPYSFPPVPNANHYIWSLPPGADFMGENDTNSVILLFSSSAVSGNISVFGENDCGDGNLCSKPVVVRNCSGIPVETSGFRFSIFPNPASGQISIMGHCNVSRLFIRISDIQGRSFLSTELSCKSGDFKLQQDVAGWTKGIYFIRLMCDQITLDKKIIIQ